MPTPTAARPSRARRASTISFPDRGFTLIELMVAIAAGLFLTLAILITQLKMTGQNTRSNDIGARDNEARAALDVISHDLGMSGFIQAGTQLSCYAVLNYNSALPGTHFYASYPVSGVAGVPNATLPFVTGGITLNYPTAASNNRSDVLLLRYTNGTTQFSSASSPYTSGTTVAGATPMTNGILPVVAPAYAFSNNTTGLVRVPVNNQGVCLRVPIISYSIGPLYPNITSAGNALMPPNNYTDFSAQMANLGLTGSITTASLAVSKVTDLNLSGQFYYVYYVTSGQYPILVRQQINALTDVLVPNSLQQIAAGVVSFQVMFGVDRGNTGGVTAYMTGPAMTAAHANACVRTVKIAMVTRSLYDDPDMVQSGSTVPIADPDFTDYNILPAETKKRFVVQTSEIAMRNEILNQPTVCP